MSIKKYKKRKIVRDLIYNSIEISKFINIIMFSGKKKTAKNIFYSALNYIKKRFNKDPLIVFNRALDNTGPMIEIKIHKIAGGNFMVPVEIKNSRRITMSMKWIKASFRARSERCAYIRLGNELFDAYNKRGLSIKKRQDLHKIADANKAYSHYYN